MGRWYEVLGVHEVGNTKGSHQWPLHRIPLMYPSGLDYCSITLSWVWAVGIIVALSIFGWLYQLTDNTQGITNCFTYIVPLTCSVTLVGHAVAILWKIWKIWGTLPMYLFSVVLYIAISMAVLNYVHVEVQHIHVITMQFIIHAWSLPMQWHAWILYQS